MTSRQKGANARRMALLFLVPMVGLILLAFGFRVAGLGASELAYDESWSIGLASLSVGHLLLTTARDTHPPLYTLLLKGWMDLAGKSAFSMRLLALGFSVALVPLSFHLGRRLFASARVGWIGAGLAALLPFYLDHARDGRSFAAAALLGALTLFVFWRRLPWPLYALVAAIAVYTLYYNAFTLLAEGIYLVTWRRNGLGWWFKAMVAAGAAFLPWLAYATQPLFLRLQGQSHGGSGFPNIWSFLPAALRSMTYSWQVPLLWLAACFGLVALWGVGAEQWRPRKLGLKSAHPGLFLVLVLVVHAAGVYAGTFVQPFYPRYFLPVEAAFLTLVALGLARLSWAGLPAGAVLLAGMAELTVTSVYPIRREASGYWRPSSVYSYLHTHARPTDRLLFNTLELAGYYESHRQPGDPSRWYFLVSEKGPYARYLQSDLAAALPGLLRAPRDWLVLYGGHDFGPNRTIAASLDRASYFLDQVQLRNNAARLYVNRPPSIHLAPRAVFGGEIELKGIDLSPGRPLLLDLHWRALRHPKTNYKVFVHLLRGGKVIAQQDVDPQAGDAPTNTWRPGQSIDDHHAVAPPDSGPYQIELGLYSGSRRLTLPDGKSSLVLPGPISPR
ncbi:MAG: glycosyltransferase family 39 protein [Chloroflexota bacterium]